MKIWHLLCLGALVTLVGTHPAQSACWAWQDCFKAYGEKKADGGKEVLPWQSTGSIPKAQTPSASTAEAGSPTALKAPQSKPPAASSASGSSSKSSKPGTKPESSNHTASSSSGSAGSTADGKGGKNEAKPSAASPKKKADTAKMPGVVFVKPTAQ
jgi:hypothetical protein